MIKFDMDNFKLMLDSLPSSHKRELKEFFSLKDIRDSLDKNDFYKIYTIDYEANYYSGPTSSITAVLYISGLDSLNYMDGIANYMFQNLPITEINVPNNIESINIGAFRFTTFLELMTLSQNISYIGNYAFEGSNLKSITYKGSMDDWDKIYKKVNWKDNSKIELIFCNDGVIEV